MKTTFKNYELRSIMSLEEIEEIRPIWESMQRHPWTDIDHYLNEINIRSDNCRPHIILLTYMGLPKSLVVGMIHNYVYKIKFASKIVYSSTVRAFSVTYRGFLGDLSEECDEILFKKIMQLLENDQVDLIHLSYLDIKSNMYRLAVTTPPILSRDLFPTVERHWITDIPESMEEFLKAMDKRHRQNLLRKGRVLEKDYPNQVKYVVYSNEDDLDTAFNDIDFIARQTYQKGSLGTFVNDEAHRKNYTLLAQKNRLRAYILYIKDEPCAFWLGEKYNDIVYFYDTGYSSQYMNYGIGTVLFLKMIENLCADKTIKYCDLGVGDYTYKSRYGKKYSEEASVDILSNNFIGIKLNILRTVIRGITHVGYFLFEKFDLINKIKKKRRQKLIMKSKQKWNNGNQND